MPLDKCLICDVDMPTGEGEEVLKQRIEHMKKHGYDYSYLLNSKKKETSDKP